MFFKIFCFVAITFKDHIHYYCDRFNLLSLEINNQSVHFFHFQIHTIYSPFIRKQWADP